MPHLVCGTYRIDLVRPVIMAIINMTPDSFSGDGLAGQGVAEALARAEQALEAGAGILDVGGESTRPGSPPVSDAEEIERVVPVVERLAGLGVPISVDTMKPAVMTAALAAGASLINDVNGLRAPGALAALAASGAGVCVMHMQGIPGTMQVAPVYGDVVGEVMEFLEARVSALKAAGVARARICLDPGFGFGKALEHNLALLRSLKRFEALGSPLLVGLSRKSMLGQITGQPVDKRMVASAVGAVLAVEQGARILRVHDVEATRDALRVWEAFNAGA